MPGLEADFDVTSDSKVFFSGHLHDVAVVLPDDSLKSGFQKNLIVVRFVTYKTTLGFRNNAASSADLVSYEGESCLNSVHASPTLPHTSS